MSTHANLKDAVVSIMQRQQKAALKDASAEDIIALALKRELRHADVDGVGRIYYYHPQSITEKDAYHRHIRYDGKEVRISLDAMVDGIIARLRNSKGEPLFQQSQRELLLKFSNDVLQSIWNALGEERALTEEQAAKS